MPSCDDTEAQYAPTRTLCHGPEHCAHDQDIRAINKVLAKHTDQLANGAVDFAEIRKDIQSTTVAINSLREVINQALAKAVDTSVIWWHEIGRACIFWLVPLIGGAFLWVLWASKQIPGAVH